MFFCVQEWADAVKGCSKYEDGHVPNVMAGYLVKSGSRSAESKTRRWFVLTPGNLSYYTDESQASLLGSLNLVEPVSVSIIPPGEDEDGDIRIFSVTGVRSSPKPLNTN